MEIVLFEPQIPQNAGNIIRTCSVTGAKLVLIKPLGFSLSSRYLKRAGLDYFEDVEVTVEEDLFDYLAKLDKDFYFFSSKGTTCYSSVSYKPNTSLIFGAETHGLPEKVFKTWPEKVLTLPMKKNARCLNLSNSVSIGLYEALRQNAFDFNLCSS